MLGALMNADSNQPNTVRKTIRAGTPPEASDKALSRTMRIPVEDIFDEVAVQRISELQIKLPGTETPIKRELINRSMIIGRAEEADITIPLKSVSREHARIFPQNEEFVIEDINSTNGTYVNGVRVNRCVLRHNDLIRVGDATILFSQQRQWSPE